MLDGTDIQEIIQIPNERTENIMLPDHALRNNKSVAKNRVENVKLV